MQRYPCQTAEDISVVLVVPSGLVEEVVTTGAPQ